MATAAPPPLSSSGDKTNGTKLSRLLIDGGTTALRNTFDGFHPPANLAANLNTNYSILNNLLRRRILNGAQWDKLFPPGGVPPDSKSFDITLLFVLLRNMCGLSPPPTGWDNMPPTSDTSLEANLARIKYFRNDLYVHVATTGVDTPTFTALWQEISVALVSLGLDQAEIDRLKAEHCGEDDYLDVLIEWVKSEEDIKSIIKEGEKTQEKALKEVKQEVKKGHQTQEKAFQEVRREVEKGHQTQEKALQKVRHEVEKGHQTQEKAFQEVKQEVTKVHQTQEEEHEMLHQLKHHIEKGHQTQETSAQTFAQIKKLQENQQEIKQVVENLQVAKENEKADEALKNLAKSEFIGDIKYHSERFQAGTREWVFKEVVDWLDDRSSQHRVMVISGNAGMGKSVISAVISKRMQEAGRLAGSHFCQHNNFRYRNPKLMLQSLACHLCRALPEYKSALVEQLSRNVGGELNSMGVQDLFALLFKEPLSTLPDPGRNILMVIDGLDESEYEGRSELLDVVSNYFCRLPGWIRFLVTTRPERNIADCLKGLNPLLLESNLANNLEDIQLFLDKQLHYMIRQEHVGAILKELVRKSEGVFLYAYLLVEHIAKNVSSLDLEQLKSSLPLGISSVYLSYFKRLESEVCKELRLMNGEKKVLSLLCAVTAAKEPLPLSFVCRMLSPIKSSAVARWVANKVIGCVSALLPIYDDRLHIFHKSVKDWLIDTSSYGEHDFTVDEKEGHRILSKLCADELDEVKRRGLYSTEFSANEKYALQHGVRHMLEVDEDSRSSSMEESVASYATDVEILYAKLHFDEESRLSSMEELVANYVTDLELLYTKLCINFAAGVDDIAHVKKAKRSESLSEEMQNTLDRLLVLLRRNGSVLRDLPHTVFQAVFNGGGPQLSLKAAEVLRKYPEIPYMEYLDKEPHNGAVKARMDCGSKVVCFDVSLKRDYMVCKCFNGMIELWSLQTNTREWIRHAVDTSTYMRYSYRQSVVFHPKDDCVLPGILSNAYTISGEWVPLFPTSCCSFSICAFSGDKTRLLTDCTDDRKHVAIWSMENGAEIQRIILEEDIKSLAYSKDGDRVAISDSTNCIYLYYVQCSSACLLGSVMVEKCDAMLFSSNRKTLVCRAKLLNYFLLSVMEICDSSGVSQIRQNRQLDRCCLWPLDSDSLSKCGFLSKDRSHRWFEHPLHVLPLNHNPGYFYMIDEDTAVISYEFAAHVTMLTVEDKMVDFELPRDEPTDAVFSLDGANVYAVMKELTGGFKATVAVFDVSSRKVKGQNSFTCTSSSFPVIPVKDGVLLLLENRSPELWNEDVNQRVQAFSQLSNIETAVPISEEVVAFGRNCSFGFKVDVLNTSSGEILSSSIIPVSGAVHLLGCTSRYQSFICTVCKRVRNEGSRLGLKGLEVKVSCWDKTSKLWETSIGYRLTHYYSECFRDDFFVMWSKGVSDHKVHVLDARTGARLHTLVVGSFLIDCALLSDGESLVCCSESFVRLFNVRSGDLLSVLDVGGSISYVSACRQKPLIAVGTRSRGFKLIRVHLLRFKDTAEKNEKEKDVLSTGQVLPSEESLQKRQLKSSKVEEEGDVWELTEAAAFISFPPKAVTEPLEITCSLWSPKTCSPPLDENEALVSNVIELSRDGLPSQKLGSDFNEGVTLALSHSATNLKGYEVVIQQLMDPQSNDWKVLETKTTWSESAGIHSDPLIRTGISGSPFPLAEAKVTQCSSFAVVWRLKSFTFSSNTSPVTDPVFTCIVPEYPDVSVAIPKSAVPENRDFSLNIKVQEVPCDEVKDDGVLVGPILHISSSPDVQVFKEPVTIQIPFFLGEARKEVPDLLPGHPRILFFNCGGKCHEWTEITEHLETSVDLKNGVPVVTFQVKHFSRFWVWFDWCKQTCANLLQCASDLYRRCMRQEAGFLACLCKTGSPESLLLALWCFPLHMRTEVQKHITSNYMVHRQGEGNSLKPLCKDDATFISDLEALTPLQEIDFKEFPLRFLGDHWCKSQDLLVRVGDKGVPKVKLSKVQPEDELICKLVMIPTIQAQSNVASTSQAQSNNVSSCPPRLSFPLPRLSDLQLLSKPLNDVKLRSAINSE